MFLDGSLPCLTKLDLSLQIAALCKKCPFGVILLHILSHSDWIRRDTQNTDQNNSEYGHFLRIADRIMHVFYLLHLIAKNKTFKKQNILEIVEYPINYLDVKMFFFHLSVTNNSGVYLKKGIFVWYKNEIF